MAYTTIDDVIAEIRGLEVNADTVVNEDTLDAWIAQADAYIEGRLAAYYSTPITGAKSLAILKMISTYKVAHRVKNKLENVSANSDKRQEVQANLDKQAEKMLAEILPTYENGKLIDPVLKLPDATPIQRSPSSGSVSSFNGATPTFIKGGSNW